MLKNKNIQIRRFKAESDYESLVEIWNEYKDQGWQPQPLTSLPQNAMVATYKGEVIGAVFLYSTDSFISMLEFLIFTKKYRNEDRDEIIDELIDKTLTIAQYLGFTQVFNWSILRPLKHRLIHKHGFIAADGANSELTNLIKTF